MSERISFTFIFLFFFFVSERLNDADGLEPVPCQPWTSRLPKMAQPDLDYIGKLLWEGEEHF